MKNRWILVPRKAGTAFLTALAVVTLFVSAAMAYHASDALDVKITNDNNNVDGGTPNPGFDAQNRQSNETTTSISPVSSNIIAVGANDYRMAPVFGDSWIGFYISQDGGATWFNTFVPGFPSDTSAAGLASPLLGLDGSGDPVVRFDGDGNLYVTGIAFNRNYDQGERPLDNVVYTARYDYTPGTPAGVSTPNSAGSPPNFTYAGTTVVDRGAVGFATPGVVGFTGTFNDKEWMEVDVNPASPCYGNVYVTYTAFHGAGGGFPIKFSVSTNGGETFSNSRTISTGGKSGTARNQGSDIAVGADGAVYVAYRTYPLGGDTASTISVVRSQDCGKLWSQPVKVGTLMESLAVGVSFRTPTFAFISADDTNANTVYVAYQSFTGAANGYDIFVQRSTDGGQTWGAPVKANDDAGQAHQIFPTIQVTNGVLHLAWYDFRNSLNGAEALDVYYACANCGSSAYPTITHNLRASDVSHNGNCLMFGGGTAAFHGDYIELDAAWDGTNQHVFVSWADNRDVPANQCDLDPTPGPASNNIGNRNQNIYGSWLLVSP